METYGKRKPENKKSSYTKGPWTIGRDGNDTNGNRRTIINGDDGTRAVELLQSGLASHENTAEANAQLIATAPKLLDATKRAFALIKESGFKSGLTEDEFDATLKQLGDAIEESEKN